MNTPACASAAVSLLHHALAAVLAFSAIWVGADARAQDDITIEEILSAWRERQESVTSLHAKWTSTTIMTKEGTYLPPTGAPNEPRPRFGPPADVTYKRNYELIVDGSASRLHTSGHLARPTDGTLVDIDDEWVFDGNARSTRLKLSSNVRGHGMIKDSSRPDFGLAALKPLIYHFWPLNPDFGSFTADNLQLTDRTAVIDGNECLCVVHDAEHGNVKEQWLYVDKKLDFVIRRSIPLRSDGTMIAQADTEFAVRGGVIHPIRWTYHLYQRPDRREMVTNSSSCEITHFALNSAVAAQEGLHSASYEPGDIVTDARGGDLKDLIVNESGELIPQIADTGPRYPLWVWWTLLAVLVVSTILWMRHRTEMRHR